MKPAVVISHRGNITAAINAEKHQSIEPKNFRTRAVTNPFTHPSKERAINAIVKTYGLNV